MRNPKGRTGARILAAVLAATLMAVVMMACACSSPQTAGNAPRVQEAVKAPSNGQHEENGTLPDGDGPSDRAQAPSTCGALRVEGTHLIGIDGQPVQLRGASTHGLAWFPGYVNGELFGELRCDWGANVVRLALYTAESGGYCTDGDKAALRQIIDDGVRFAAENDLYVIVDWHILSDNDPNIHADEAESFFRDISAAYADRDNVLYEICNEPNGPTTWTDVKAYAERIIPVIRENDPDAIVIVGTPTWSQDVDAAAADPLAFDNVMYTLHFYAATHTDDLRAKASAAIDAGLPLFVTEFGICDASGNGAIDEAQANAWIEFLDGRGVSYAMWNLSNKDESSAMFLTSCEKTSGFTDDDLSQSGLWLKRTLAKHATD